MLGEAEKVPAPHFLVGCDVRVLVQAIGVERWVRDGMVSSHRATGRDGETGVVGLPVMRGPEGPGVRD